MTTCAVCELHAESTFKVEGMCCREEVSILERRFRHLTGLEDFTADLMSQRIHVKYDAAKVSTSAIVAAVADAGMRAWLEHEEPLPADGAPARRRRNLLAAAGAAFMAGLVADLVSAPSLVSQSFYLLSLGTGLPLNVPRAWRSLRLRSLDIHVLMLAAVIGAMALGEWSEAAAVVFLFALAQALEARTLERARTAVRALMDLTPQDVLVRDAQGERRVEADQVRPGAVIVIKPGEKVPLDGVVMAGESAVNQAPVTGESLPARRRRRRGLRWDRSTVAVHSTFVSRVIAAIRTLARIIHLVEQAQAQRAPVQTFVERFARVYTPAVLTLAALIAIVPPLATGSDWRTWIYRSLVLLVVSCPCALVISTPVSIVAALSGAARKGVLIKGGAHLERAAAVRCVAFDKTGTLTPGRPEVVDIVSLNGVSSRELVALAAAVEQRSDHPIARAIVTHAEASRDCRGARDAGDGSLGTRRRRPGGWRARHPRQSPPLRGTRLCSPDVHVKIAEISARRRTPVLIAREGRTLGLLAVADRPRDAARRITGVAEGTRHPSHRDVDGRQSGHCRRRRSRTWRGRVSRRAPARGQGVGGDELVAPRRRGDGGRRHQRRAGAGGGRCGIRDGRRGQRRRA